MQCQREDPLACARTWHSPHVRPRTAAFSHLTDSAAILAKTSCVFNMHACAHPSRCMRRGLRTSRSVWHASASCACGQAKRLGEKHEVLNKNRSLRARLKPSSIRNRIIPKLANACELAGRRTNSCRRRCTSRLNSSHCMRHAEPEKKN